LTIGIDWNDFVLAGDAAALVDEINRDLRSDGAGGRAASCKWTGQVVDHANPNALCLRAGDASGNAQCHDTRGGILQQCPA